MKKTGTLLKEKRESANLTLSEVALATKINPKILTAIENGDESQLPAKTFLKGFVRSYALFLKMDVEEVLRSFHGETGGAPSERVHEAYKTDASSTTSVSRRSMDDENSSGMRTAAVVVIVLLIGLILGVRELIEKYQRERIVNTDEPVKAKPLEAPPVETPTPSVTPPAQVAVAPPPAPVAVPPPASVAAPAPVAETPVSPPAVVPPAPVPAPPPSVPVPEAKVESKPAAPKAAKNEIILEALDNVEVKMQIKGEKKRISLGPTQVHTIRSVDPVSLEFSDGGAVSLIVNGHERGPVGELGKPKQITIP